MTLAECLVHLLYGHHRVYHELYVAYCSSWVIGRKRGSFHKQITKL